MSEQAESRTIRQAVAGDERAFERLIGRWDGEVLNLAYRLTGNLEDARDVRQAAFIRTYEALPKFDGRSRFSTWLFRIVVNLCRDQQRRDQSSQRRLRIVADRPPRTGPDGSEARGQLEREELGEAVAAAVGALPDEQREVLVLRHYHQASIAEISRVLELPETTARSRLAKALERLRDALERTERTHPEHRTTDQ